MAFSEDYLRQSTLMLQILPIVAEQKDFALKGGTAINYFYRDMPRISVDIDLVYLPITDRQATIAGINASMKSLEKSLTNEIWRTLPDARKQQEALLRLRIYENDVQVKVETNGIFRGTVFPPQLNSLANNAAQVHGIKPFNVTCASFEDVYAGKFCAALTRQHPRDLFDLKHFFENHDITNNLRQAFIVYLCSDRRPFHEVLSPRVKLESKTYLTEFNGMATEKINYDQLHPLVNQLADSLIKDFTKDEKTFILSMAHGEPDWDKMPFAHLSTMPSLQWKLMNVRQMESSKREQSISALNAILDHSAIHTVKNTKPTLSITIPVLEIGVRKEEVLALHTSTHAPLKQIGALLKELFDGQRTTQDENWCFLPTILKSIIKDPIQSKHFKTSAPQLFNAVKRKMNEQTISKERTY